MLMLSLVDALGIASGRAGTATPRGSPPPPSGLVARIEASEITQAIAERGDGGISLGDLLRVFVHRLNQPGSTTKSEWLTLVKQNAVYGPDKLLRPRPT
jgi:transcription initiation factor TFIIF subunit alpha